MTQDVCFLKNSNIVHRIKYVRSKGILEILFKSGNIQYYHNVPMEVWNEFKESDSPGMFFYHSLRNKYDFSLELADCCQLNNERADGCRPNN
jgi:hypothetical protein